MIFLRPAKKYTFLFSLCLFTGVAAMYTSACKKQQHQKELNYINLSIPDGFPLPVQDFSQNPFSKEGIELGRKLFYDGILSRDGNFPCSSCHQQIAAFGTYEHDRSHGYNDSHTLRNAPVLFNLAWSPSFHWDHRFTSLYQAAAQPINDPIEMAESFDAVVKKIQQNPDYVKAFRQVFGTNFISPDHILKALEQFTASLISANSKYDRVKNGQEQFTTDEAAGYQFFLQKCNSCHTEPLFTNYSMHNIGLPIDPWLNDFGKMLHTGNAEDSLLFRVPTLRNVRLSSNYMHDGRFITITQVINHYRSGIQESETLSPSLKGGFSISDTELRQLSAFLYTLTDSSFINNPLYARP